MHSEDSAVEEVAFQISFDEVSTLTAGPIYCVSGCELDESGSVVNFWSGFIDVAP